MNKVYLIVGCPGSGKSWVANQLRDQFQYVEHDKHDEKVYGSALFAAATKGSKPVLGDIPFGLSKFQEYLEAKGVDVVPVFIQEKDDVVKARYQARDKKPIPQGHLTRQRTYAKRAVELNAFSGTAQEVLEHLRRGL